MTGKRSRTVDHTIRQALQIGRGGHNWAGRRIDRAANFALRSFDRPDPFGEIIRYAPLRGERAAEQQV